MSLQFRVLGSVIALLFLALAAGAILLFVHAHSVVDLEVRTAFEGSVQSVRDTLRSDVEHTVTLREVVSSFHGQRHVRAELVNEAGKMIVRSRLGQVVDPAPDWFHHIMAPPPLSARVPLALPKYPCVLVLTSDPGNEIAEVWSHARDAFIIMLLFCVATLAVVSLVLASAVRFFRELQVGLLSISAGNYDTRLPVQGPPEFARLLDGFNHMAAQLSAFARSNRHLYQQLQNVQEEERAEIARDLHDEVGPYLFTIQVDAAAVRKLGPPEAERLGTAVRDAVIHIQEHVKNILRQLRPAPQLEFGLESAIRDLTAFWARRRPEVRFEQVILLHEKLPWRYEEVAYRIVQESLSNAIRHGQPSMIRIDIRSRHEELSVMVEDDGGGLKAGGEDGVSLGQTGVAGMRERVLGLKGQFRVQARPGKGVQVCATLPFAREREAA
jgi:two-component system sensor histidine kinase UhpB